MDHRDRYNTTHHRKRLAVAAHFPVERCLLDAERLEQRALRQRRTHFYLLIRLWRADLEKQK